MSPARWGRATISRSTSRCPAVWAGQLTHLQAGSGGGAGWYAGRILKVLRRLAAEPTVSVRWADGSGVWRRVDLSDHTWRPRTAEGTEPSSSCQGRLRMHESDLSDEDSESSEYEAEMDLSEAEPKLTERQMGQIRVPKVSSGFRKSAAAEQEQATSQTECEQEPSRGTKRKSDPPASAPGSKREAGPPSQKASPEDSEDESEEEPEYEVEQLLKHRRGDDGQWELLVKWKGYEEVKWNTWEPLEGLRESASELLGEYMQRNPELGSAAEQLAEQTARQAVAQALSKRGVNEQPADEPLSEGEPGSADISQTECEQEPSRGTKRKSDPPASAPGFKREAGPPSQKASPQDSEDESEEEPEYEVEQLLKHRRGDDGQWELLVKWKGYEEVKWNTWEPLEGLRESASELLGEYMQRNPELGSAAEQLAEQTAKQAVAQALSKRGLNEEPAGEPLSEGEPGSADIDLEDFRSDKGSTGYLGVYRQVGSDRYRAVIRMDNRDCMLGSYDGLKEAARVYARKYLELHGAPPNRGTKTATNRAERLQMDLSEAEPKLTERQQIALLGAAAEQEQATSQTECEQEPSRGTKRKSDPPASAPGSKRGAGPPSQKASPQDSEDESEEEPEYEVEQLLKHRRGGNGQWELLVKWKGYEEVKWNTWEPLEGLRESASELLGEYMQRNPELGSAAEQLAEQRSRATPANGAKRRRSDAEEQEETPKKRRTASEPDEAKATSADRQPIKMNAAFMSSPPAQSSLGLNRPNNIQLMLDREKALRSSIEVNEKALRRKLNISEREKWLVEQNLAQKEGALQKATKALEVLTELKKQERSADQQKKERWQKEAREPLERQLAAKEGEMSKMHQRIHTEYVSRKQRWTTEARKEERERLYPEMRRIRRMEKKATDELSLAKGELLQVRDENSALRRENVKLKNEGRNPKLQDENVALRRENVRMKNEARELRKKLDNSGKQSTNVFGDRVKQTMQTLISRIGKELRSSGPEEKKKKRKELLLFFHPDKWSKVRELNWIAEEVTKVMPKEIY